MKLKDFYKKFGLNQTKAIISILFNYTSNNIYKLEKFIEENGENEIVFQDKDIIEIVSLVNQMVKSSDCPNNLKNRFYHKKKMFVRNYLLKEKKVEQIIESENLYKFIVGKYSFHQPKVYFPCGFCKIDGTEVYEPNTPAVPFDVDVYKDCMLLMTRALIRKF